MSLPTVNPQKLQQICTQIESRKNNLSLEDLSNVVSLSGWAQENDLSPENIKDLIVHHKISINTKEKDQPKPVTKDQPKPVITTDSSNPRVIKASDKGGPGKKQCTSCKKYVGVKTRICICGHEFSSSQPKVSGIFAPAIIAEEKIAPKYTMPSYMSINSYFVIIAPGKPPVSLKDFTYDSVCDWIEENRKVGVNRNRWYSRKVFLNWARHILSNEDLKTVREFINDYCSQQQYG